MASKKTWWQTVDNLKEADIALFGVPYDFTASFQKGTVYGPKSFRENMEFGLETWSPYQNKELMEEIKLFDAGNIEVDNNQKPHIMNDKIEKFIDNLLKENQKVKTLLIGGEHSASYPVFKSLLKKHPNLHLIHFDAHTDLRDEFYGEPFSHACIVKKCIDLIGPGKTFQFGIRSGSKAEFDLHKKGLTNIEKFKANTALEVAKKLQNVPVYITIDIDVLDPSIAPGTGTPEAGGMTYEELILALKQISANVQNVVGIDLMELSPPLDSSLQTTVIALKIIREVLLMFWGKK